MSSQNVSIICTTYNEEETILRLLEALRMQTVPASEIIVCDGNSEDSTQQLITNYIQKYPQVKIKLLSKKGNRSIGRNTAIKSASTPLIAITDAGCIPEKNWLAELLKTYHATKAPVIAGYYKGLPKTAFEEAVVPYVLVMPDKVNPKTFLPATRSMMIEKQVWQTLGGFDEKLANNEDYAFAKNIRTIAIEIAFAKDAKVGWIPRKNLQEFWTMIRRFAQGDIEAGLIRPKVVFIFVRYLGLLGVVTLLLFVSDIRHIGALLLTVFVLYSLWAIQKNIQYAPKGWYWLPVLQVVSDLAVMKGSLSGAQKLYQ